MSRQRPNRNNNQFAPRKPRSILLEDYRTHRYPNLQLNEIISHVVEFAKDFDGSKFIQRKLDDATENRKEAIFREMRPHLHTLAMDTFGNFVVQKFFDVGSESQKETIITLIRGNFGIFSLNKYACRVVQTAIEKSSRIHQMSIINSATGDQIQTLISDPNGNHVIQKFFRCCLPDVQNVIFDQMRYKVVRLCMDLYGCRVVQCILNHGTIIHKREIVAEIRPHLMQVVTHRYGNYVIQYALYNSPPAQQHRIIEEILDNTYELSQQKYSSNVVEKCLELAFNVAPDAFKKSFVETCDLNPFDIYKLCVDAYANYPIQKMIELGQILLCQQFYQKVRPYFSRMRQIVCGQKVIEKLQHRVNNLA